MTGRANALPARPRLDSEPPATVGVPPRDRLDRVWTFDGDTLQPARLDRLVPARRNESRREVGQRCEDEQPLARVPMRDVEQPRRLRRIGRGLDRAGLGRSIDRKPGSAEDEQVEVELARTPAPPTPAPKTALEHLQRREELGRTDLRVRAGRNVERHDRVAKIGLIGDADRGSRVQEGDAPKPYAGEPCERLNRLGQRSLGVTDVRPEPDVGSDSPRAHEPSMVCSIDSGAMRDVAVWILHPEPGSGAGPLEQWVAAERSRIAERHRDGFLRAGAATARIVSGPPDDTSFGARLRGLVEEARPRPSGAIVLGSGAVPLATIRDRRVFVATAAAAARTALANNRYSADVVSIACVESLLALPDLPADNALPRWLEEVAGYRVDDLRNRWRLAFDVDGPLDLLLMGRAGGAPAGDIETARARLGAVASVAADRRAELVVAGRTSAATLRWLETAAHARVRALVEERGMRAASVLAQAGDQSGPRRGPASVLGLLLDRDGPASIGGHLERLGDAAVVDSRVLLAHLFGADERDWPPAEDRFASDLLLPERVADPWLRDLTASAVRARIPIALGGHTLVGVGLRLLLRASRWT